MLSPRWRIAHSAVLMSVLKMRLVMQLANRLLASSSPCPPCGGQDRRCPSGSSIRRAKGRDEFRAVKARNAERQELGWRQLELRLELVERGRAFIEAARERLDQLWERAEAAMARIKERVMGEVDRSQASVDRGDIEARRAAVLGRAVEPQRQGEDVGRERPAQDDPEKARRDAILGRPREGGAERDAPGKDRDRER